MERGRMNSKKAKALRKEVYGDTALRQKREYVGIVRKMYCTPDLKEIPVVQIINEPSSNRAIYQKAKKMKKVVSRRS